MPRKQGKLTKASANGRMTAKPVARSQDLVIEELGDELLVYDVTTNHAHSLGSPAARVWRACDGQTTIDALSARTNLDGETVARAVDELRACALLDGETHFGEYSGMTRRQMTFKVAQVGAAAAAVPLIWSVAGPIPEAAATPTVADCQFYTDESCDACSRVCGCCCCCQAGGECKTCYPTGICSMFTCPGGGAKKGNCSTTAAPAPPNCVEADITKPFNCKKGQVRTPTGPPCCTP